MQWHLIHKKCMSLTVVLGASPNPERFSYKAVKRLISNNYQVVAIGKREGYIDNIPIITGQPAIERCSYRTMYLAPYHQGEIFDYVLSLPTQTCYFQSRHRKP